MRYAYIPKNDSTRAKLEALIPDVDVVELAEPGKQLYTKESKDNQPVYSPPLYFPVECPATFDQQLAELLENKVQAMEAQTKRYNRAVRETIQANRECEALKNELCIRESQFREQEHQIDQLEAALKEANNPEIIWSMGTSSMPHSFVEVEGSTHLRVHDGRGNTCRIKALPADRTALEPWEIAWEQSLVSKLTSLTGKAADELKAAFKADFIKFTERK